LVQLSSNQYIPIGGDPPGLYRAVACGLGLCAPDPGTGDVTVVSEPSPIA